MKKKGTGTRHHSDQRNIIINNNIIHNNNNAGLVSLFTQKSIVRDVTHPMQSSFAHWSVERMQELLVENNIQVRGSRHTYHETLVRICDQVFGADGYQDHGVEEGKEQTMMETKKDDISFQRNIKTKQKQKQNKKISISFTVWSDCRMLKKHFDVEKLFPHSTIVIIVDCCWSFKRRNSFFHNYCFRFRGRISCIIKSSMDHNLFGKAKGHTLHCACGIIMHTWDLFADKVEEFLEHERIGHYEESGTRELCTTRMGLGGGTQKFFFHCYFMNRY